MTRAAAENRHPSRTDTMKRTFAHLLAAVVLAAGIAVAPPPARAADEASYGSASELSGRVVRLALNKSLVVNLPEDVKDVMVANPAVADAVVRTNRKIYLIGVSAGETNVFLFGEGGRQLAQFELVVARDTVGLEATIQGVVPGAKIRAQSLGDSIVLSGTAPSAEAALKAAEIAAKFVGDPAKVVNSIAIAGSDQVNLRVVIAEVQRNAARQLGVDFSFNATGGGVSFNPIVSNPFGVAGAALSDTALKITASDFSATVRALEQDGILKTLAEPNLTAVSGESASFLVGGEFPAISGITDSGRIEYQFKPYGVGLNFTPIVLSPGRISLKIKTEISELDNSNKLKITTGAESDISILGFKTRRAETVVELPSGGSLAIGGLVKDDVRQSLSGVPGLMDLPILGSLFKSRDFQRQQTELVIFVTPYVVDPVATSALARPDQNLGFASDAQTYFLNQVNKVYANRGTSPTGAYTGRFGFAYE